MAAVSAAVANRLVARLGRVPPRYPANACWRVPHEYARMLGIERETLRDPVIAVVTDARSEREAIRLAGGPDLRRYLDRWAAALWLAGFHRHELRHSRSPGDLIWNHATPRLPYPTIVAGDGRQYAMTAAGVRLAPPRHAQVVGFCWGPPCPR